VSGRQASLIPGAAAGIEDFPVALAWTSDSKALIAGGGEGGIHRVQAQDGTVRKLGEHAPGVLQLAVQPQGNLLASSGQDGSVRLWNSAGDELIAQSTHRVKGWPAGLAWRADGAALAFGVGKQVLVFDSGGRLQRELSAHSVPLSHLGWRGRNEIIAAGNGALFVDDVDAAVVEQFVLEGTPQTLALTHERIRGQGGPDVLERQQPLSRDGVIGLEQHRGLGLRRQRA
jgi:WD40 repeat protein